MACDCAPDCGERIECDRVGQLGHFGCGWCETHGQARHLCYCPVSDTNTYKMKGAGQ